MDSFSATAARMPSLERRIADDPGAFRVLTGERPTGALHLGHYFGTIRERVRLQDLGVETFVILADYQVITDRDSAEDIAGNVRSAVADYLAAGLDPERTTIFAHSAVPALHQLLLPFLSLVTEAELHRNPTVKAEHAASGRALSGLLLTYPVHQAADILFCKGTLVPVGKDNLPHVELTRVIARRFAERYGAVFPEPEALITETPELPGLDGRKMSKSYGNAISLSMTADETAALIRRTPTDAERAITFDPERRPGVSGLLQAAAVCRGVSPELVADEVGAGGASALKALTTEAVNEFLAPHRSPRCGHRRPRTRGRRAAARQRTGAGDRGRDAAGGAGGDGHGIRERLSALRAPLRSRDGHSRGVRVRDARRRRRDPASRPDRDRAARRPRLGVPRRRRRRRPPAPHGADHRRLPPGERAHREAAPAQRTLIPGGIDPRSRYVAAPDQRAATMPSGSLTGRRQTKARQSKTRSATSPLPSNSSKPSSANARA